MDKLCIISDFSHLTILSLFMYVNQEKRYNRSSYPKVKGENHLQVHAKTPPTFTFLT